MRRLLVATDLSARSDRALQRAVDLAHQHHAVLTVLHVVDENLPDRTVAAVRDAATAEIWAMLTDMAGKSEVTVTLNTVVGVHFREILGVAEREASDLIILGRHRNETCVPGIGGATIDRVIRMGQRPVLMVSERPACGYAKVLVGMDFSEHARHALRLALALAPDAEFHLVHAFDVPFQGFLPGESTRREIDRDHDGALTRLIEEELAAHAGTCGAVRPRIEKILEQGDVIGVLRRQTERVGPDLLAIGTHGRSGLSGMVLGSVAQALIQRPPCDILAVRLPQ